ncbi:MAG: hypothetical protein JWQ64_2548 [Subtercola sp.]|jgi:hypothetical protein|nr:hypothetical protein [Subtercola sp.]
MNDAPRFDPRRSDAIRRMLVQTASATSSASVRPRRSRGRTLLIILVVVLAGLIGSGTTALALNGGAWFGAAPSIATVPPSDTVSPPATSHPPASPSAAPTAPSNPPAPVIRLPATCDQLATASDAEAIIGASLQPAVSLEQANPASYSDRRVGALECSWNTDGSSSYTPNQPAFGYSIVPGVTPDAYALYLNGESWTGAQAEPGIDENTHSRCDTFEPNQCAYIDYVDGYGIDFSLQSGTALTDEQKRETRALFVSVVKKVMAFGDPSPLWQPDGATLAGASSCDDFITTDQLAADLAVPKVDEFKSDGGEYSSSEFQTPTQVNAFWCSWSDTVPGSSAEAFASVLPGGASYFATFMAYDQHIAGDQQYDWQRSSQFPGEAYVSSFGGESWVSILINGGWIEVRASTPGALAKIAQTVLANVS